MLSHKIKEATESQDNDIKGDYTAMLEDIKKIEETKNISLEQLKATLQELWKGVESMLEMKTLNASIVGNMEELKTSKAELESMVERVNADKKELIKKLEESQLKSQKLNSELTKIKNIMVTHSKAKEELIVNIEAIFKSFTQQLTTNFQEITQKLNNTKTQLKQQSHTYEYTL